MIKKIIVGCCIILVSGIAFTNIYTSLVDATSWGADMPNSVYVARAYYKIVNPGNYFRIFSPMLQVFALLLLIACWKMGATMRWLCFAALLLAVGSDAFTFGYFYPRNEIIFSSTDMDMARKAVTEWASMNWIRTALAFVTTGIFFTIQQKIHTKQIVNS